jgi:uncharacterized protein YjbI with pentapeptide repeats
LPNNFDLLLEAEKRGLLPDNKKALLAEARARGLVPAAAAGSPAPGANLTDAYLGDADLAGANLGGAYLGGADLGGADLSGADLGGADLGSQWVIQGGTRSDGYFFMLTNLAGEGVRVKAGCRNFSIADAEAHWMRTRGGTVLGKETFAIINAMGEIACMRKLSFDLIQAIGKKAA